jgi:hypothetical protein
MKEIRRGESKGWSGRTLDLKKKRAILGQKIKRFNRPFAGAL